MGKPGSVQAYRADSVKPVSLLPEERLEGVFKSCHGGESRNSPDGGEEQKGPKEMIIGILERKNGQTSKALFQKFHAGTGKTKL